MLAGEAGEAVAEQALKVGNKLVVAAGDAIEESEEARAIAARADGRDLRYVVFGPMWTSLASSKINHAVGRVEQPRVGVPLVDGGGEPPVRSRQALDSRNSLCAGE